MFKAGTQWYWEGPWTPGAWSPEIYWIQKFVVGSIEHPCYKIRE